MHRPTRMLRRLAVTVAAIGVLFAVTAGSASAFTWNPGFPIEVTGDLTFDRDGHAPVTCSIDATRTAHLDDMGGPCDNGSETLLWGLLSPYTFVPFGTQYPTPWGGGYPWYMSTTVGDWVEGDASTPSRIVFDDAPAGTAGGAYPYQDPVSISGELEITTPTGGLVTYSL